MFDALTANPERFPEFALETFRFQAAHCPPYRDYLGALRVDPAGVGSLDEIPFLPIEFFKSRDVYAGAAPPETVFTSSGTTGQTPSRHPVASLALYETSFRRGFEYFYGDPVRWSICSLLPDDLERSGSSLVYMADRLMAASGRGGFFLHDYGRLLGEIEAAARRGEPILLLGVTFALWELAERHRFSYPGMVVMETGGMKGRREELPRDELHRLFCDSFGVEAIHSEYGMTELLSQGYSAGGGIFRCPPWMRITVRDASDPGALLPPGRGGGVNVVDLANRYSCSFIATRDLGVDLGGGAFRIDGRLDGSEIRGCNLLVQDAH